MLLVVVEATAATEMVTMPMEETTTVVTTVEMVALPEATMATVVEAAVLLEVTLLFLLHTVLSVDQAATGTACFEMPSIASKG